MSDHKYLSRLRGATPQQIAGCALVAFGVIALAVTVTSMVESYANLVQFGLAHGMRAWHGVIAPVAVDTFIVMGELLLLAALLLRWPGKGLYALATALTAFGFALSVGGNVFRDEALPAWAGRAVQALWPVTATAALAAGLVVLKRLMAGPALQAPPPAPAREPRPAPARRVPRAARKPGLAAAPARQLRGVLTGAELELAARLAASGLPFPGEQKLAALEGIPRRRAQRVLAEARSRSNGHGDDDGHGA